MRRLIVIFIVAFLPLQGAWATMAEYCMHESGAGADTRHFGHHFHKHQPSTGDSQSDSSQGKGGPDRDCGFCHLNLKLVPPTSFAAPLYTELYLVAPPSPPHFSSHIPKAPERPNWQALA